VFPGFTRLKSESGTSLFVTLIVTDISLFFVSFVMDCNEYIVPRRCDLVHRYMNEYFMIIIILTQFRQQTVYCNLPENVNHMVMCVPKCAGVNG